MEPLRRSLSRGDRYQSTTPLLQPEPPSEIVKRHVANQGERRALGHVEKHAQHGDVIRDIIIGFADGLTVPFALTAGLSSSVPPHPLFPNLTSSLIYSQHNLD